MLQLQKQLEQQPFEHGPALHVPDDAVAEEQPPAEADTEEEADAQAEPPATPVMGQQFEDVDPVLLGEEKPEAASSGSARRHPLPEPVPADPAADEAYEELVDRLVRFNHSQKKKWYQFWK